MKYFLFLTVLFFSACNPITMDKFAVYYTYDFTEYTQEGFLITPHSYSGKYESIALLTVEVFPSIRRKTTEDDPNNKLHSNYILGQITTKEVIDSLYLHAKRMGADAIINFTTNRDVYYQNGASKVPGIGASGYAIKRK